MKHSLLLLVLLLLTSCAARPTSPPAVLPSGSDLAQPFAEALRTEQLGTESEATEAYLSLLDRAIANPAAPHALEAALASLDALVLRKTPGLDEIAEHHALAFRAPSGMQLVRERLRAAWEAADRSGPFVRPAIARAAYLLAMHAGDAEAAADLREKMGCVREATLLGPLAAMPLTSLRKELPLENATSALASTYAGLSPFATTVTPTLIEADECALPTHATNLLPGLGALVVDVEVPRPMRLGVSLRSPSAAIVVVGGKLAIDRGYDRGGAQLAALATVDVPRGHVRAVVKIAHKGETKPVELAFFDDEGRPLRFFAPRPGDAAAVSAVRAEGLSFAALRDSSEERALVAAGLLALDDGRPAAYLLEKAGRAEDAKVALLHARAITEGAHLPAIRSAEQLRAAYESTLASWPGAWEAILGRARLEARRQGGIEGQVAMLRELGQAKTPLLQLVEASVANAAAMPDVAEKALRAGQAAFAGTPLLAKLEGALHRRIGAEQEAWACRGALLDRGSLDCYAAHVAKGDHEAALGELSRLRRLRGSPAALRPLELSLHLSRGDRVGAMRAFESMHPAERLASALGLLAGDSPEKVRAGLGEILRSRDVPLALGPLHRALGDDPAVLAEAEGARLVEADRKKRKISDATTVLLHRETYTLEKTGRLHYVLHDLRRLAGTTDIELGAQIAGPLVGGRDARFTLRRRVYKADGRIVEPDAAPYAAQGHTDLTQLEQGDYVEQIVEGFALPDATGQLVVDTPDLLPERTRIREATIELRRPKDLELSLSAHELLGPATSTLEGEVRTTRYVVRDRAPRRLEFGVARMDQDVALSFGTSSWAQVAEAFAESAAMMEDRDPTVSAWAQKAAEGLPSGRALLEKLAQATGRVVKVASPWSLSDWGAAHAHGAQPSSARTVLELGQGSRSWLLYRALKELGIPAELRFAETEPFSARSDFPAHYGRFQHPLVVARLDEGEVFLDLDVAGPPLPSGRVSPELRGRLALNAEGKLTKVPAGEAEEARDEVDLRLSLDESGNATGTVKIVLRGRQAQMLSDSLEEVVGSDKEAMLRNAVLGWLPWASVNEVALSSEAGSWEVRLEAQVSILAYAQVESAGFTLPGLDPVHVAFPAPFVATLGATFASQASRQSALSIDVALQYRFRRRVELPKGTKLAAALPSLETNSPHIEASRAVAFDSGVLEETLSLSLPTGTVPQADYGEFLETVRKVDEGFLQTTRLSPSL